MLKGIVNGVEKDIIRIPMIGDAPATVTGINSVTFETDATSVIGYEVEGNMQQTGTPSPDNIIMPDFCGERTAQLIPEIVQGGISTTTGEMSSSITRVRTNYISVIAGETYTVTSGNIYISTIVYYNGNALVGNETGVTDLTEKSFTVPQGANAVGIGFKKLNGGANVRPSEAGNIMLNSGSTALPYEPYGYKIPITCAGQTVPVYLGQTQTVRKIKKLVLTGKENWQVGTENFYIFINTSPGVPYSPAICTHAKNSSVNNNGNALWIKKADFPDASTAGDFKSYLSQQYASGTPVTVWYVLAEPETGIVNEPLCKIGEYADELHSEDAGVSIPTAKGQNTLSIGTTLSPSSTEVTYLGIKNAYKEGWEVRDNQDRLIWGYNSTISGVPPLTFKGGGTPLISWSMLGNAQQTGTPSPDNIIVPDFCGVRTANLFDIASATQGKILAYDGVSENANANYFISDYIPITANLYKLSMKNTYDGTGNTTNRVCLYDTNKQLISIPVDVTGARDRTVSYTIDTTGAAFMRISLRNTDINVMLNSGSTALPYEPYGYKIPITCAGQTVPIHLGQTQTVRRIKKLVLTGEENWGISNSRFYLASITQDYLRGSGLALALCSHYASSPQTSLATNVPDGSISFSYATAQRLYCYDSAITTVEAFKSYLSQQYAAGTPVTVWYVLATPETAIVNEPLCKIGEYADELHSEDTTVSIPTANGENTLTVDTTLSPSSVSITGHIKSTS